MFSQKSARGDKAHTRTGERSSCSTSISSKDPYDGLSSTASTQVNSVRGKATMSLALEWTDSRGCWMVASVVVMVLSRYRRDRRRRDGWQKVVCICIFTVSCLSKFTPSRAPAHAPRRTGGISHRVAALGRLLLFADVVTSSVSSAWEAPGRARDFFYRKLNGQ